MTANRQGTTKKKKRGPGKPFAKGPDPRRNLAGRPALGESYKEIFTNVGNLTVGQLKERYPVYGDRLDNIDDDVKLKDMVALSVLVGLACEPSPGLLGALLEYTDGPPERKLKLSGMTDDEIASAVRPIFERLGIGIIAPVGEGLQDQADSGDKPA